MENLATIQEVTNVRHHPNADSLDIVNVLGWQVITKRDEYKNGDLCVYVVSDTILPEHPSFEFLRNKNFRINPIRLRKEESSGIAFPTSILSKFNCDLNNPIYKGLDVTEVIGVKHYEKQIPASLAGMAIGGLPGFLIMTDELNLRTYPTAITELNKLPYYITRKDDGCSGTYFIKDGKFGVCSRRLQLVENDTNGYWRMAHKYDIENKLKQAFPGKDITIQGEVVGPGIQDNHLGLNELELHIFNLFDIKTRSYLDYKDIKSFCNEYNLQMVTLIDEGEEFNYTLEDLIKLSSKQVYHQVNHSKDISAEGIVIRPKINFRSGILNKYWSGKVLNPLYDTK